MLKWEMPYYITYVSLCDNYLNIDNIVADF